MSLNFMKYALVSIFFCFLLNLFFIYFVQKLNIENTYLNNTWCPNLNNSFAQSTLERLKTDKCKKKVFDFVCQQKVPSILLNTCQHFDAKLKGTYLGCYKDSKNKRVLSSFDTIISISNTPNKCINTCLRGGYMYSGVEFIKECFCGEESNLNDSSLIKLPDSYCQKYKCPSPNENLYCGGYEAIAIYATGMKQHKRLYPVYVENNYEINKEVKILFLLQLNGRNDRQVKRMLKSVYRPNHYYIVHVDKRQKYMFNEMKKLEKILPNFKVSDERWSTIWGGASLLTMYLKLVESQMDKDWDFVINMSESDFLVIPLDELEVQLIANKGISFLSSHGSNSGKFIKKQGFYYKFMECEERMWRIEERNNFPENMYIDGGSDWIVIHRDFIKYSLSNETLPRDLRNMFQSVLLPLESFFHTLGYNSQFCNKIKARNLRLTYWKRTQGCRCAKLKKTVDWCGCSPLVFRNNDISFIHYNTVKQKATYFARKFDDFVDITAIHFAELQALKNKKNRNKIILVNDESYNHSWVNLYSLESDGDNELIYNWAKILMELKNDCFLINVTNIYTFKSSPSSKVYFVINLNAKCSGTPTNIELLVDYVEEKKLTENFIINDFLLLDVKIGFNLDLKEEIFRDSTNLFTKTGTVYILISWKQQNENIASSERKTSPPIYLEWYDGNEILVAAQNVSAYDSIFSNQYSFLELDTISNIKYGTWKVVFKNLSKNMTGAIINFPLFDVSDFNNMHFLTEKFYKVIDNCLGNNCMNFSWSTAFPNPKSDIKKGYDKKMEWLV
uniref:protein xylosyltransferase n=1 Tax=Parastrongyloides trichosuri TaxID=131310 RepID=A0A0N4ZRJ1_PARTI